MSKLISYDLFWLIKSLSKQEKRHFKIFSTRHVVGNGNNYVRLFDAIEKQKVYDEKKITQTEKYISDISVEKNRLYAILLKSLVFYHSRSSTEQILKNQVSSIEVLFGKGLFVQCRKIIEKTRKTAEKHELWRILAEVFYWQINIMIAEGFQNNTIPDIDSSFARLHEISNKQAELNNNRLFQCITLARIRKSAQVKNKKDEKEFKDALDPYYIPNENGLSYSALIYNYTAKAIFNMVIYNYEKASVFYGKILKLIEKYPHIIDNNPKQYATCLYNFILTNILLRRISSDLHICIDKLRNIDFDSTFEKNQFQMSAHYLEICIYSITGEFEKGNLLINKLRKLNIFFPDKKNNVYEVITIGLHYYVACIYFGLGDYKQSNKYLNYILNYNSTLTNDFNRASKIISLLIDFETGKSDLMEYSIKSTYKYLFKRRDASKAEVLVLEFLKNQLKKQSIDQELIKSFKKLKLELEKLKNDRFEKNSLNDFDYIGWLESKIENRPFADIVRKKALQKMV